MLTPVFHLDQNDKHLIVTIRAPYCKLQDAEVSYDGDTFLFHAKPYFLRLFLTGELIDDETGTCSYESDSGQFTICATKKNAGEHFPRLEMLSELLKPQRNMPSANRPVELIVAKDENDVEEAKEKDDDKSNGSDNQLINDDVLYAKQSFCNENSYPGTIDASAEEIFEKFGYGFGWTRHGVLSRFADEIEGLIDLADPDNVPIDERIEKLRQFDEQKFYEQHYLADLFMPEQIQLDAMEFELDEKQHLKLTEEDLNELKDLKIRQLEKFTPEITKQIALFLVDVLFAFLYDLRTTLGEHNIESGWTISKLSPSLTFLVRWHSVRQAMLAVVRHSMVLPIIRNWNLAICVLKDLRKTLKIGRSAILHCLLTCRRIFIRSGEFRYLFNQLFLDDCCLWIQSVPDEVLTNLFAEFKQEMHNELNKNELLELDLEFLETQARMEMLKPLDSDDDCEPGQLQQTGKTRL